MAAENGFALLKQQQTNRVMGRTAIVQKVIVEQEPTFGKLRYELETKGGTGTEKYIHVDPNKEPQVYQAMLTLLPDIANLREDKRELRSLVLAKQWEVEYCYERRTFKNSSREVKVAVNIRQIPTKAAPDLPAWATSDNDMHEFASECHSVWAPMTPGNFLDQTLGLPRSAWPDRQTCKAKIDEMQKATGKQLRPVEKPEDLDAWLGRKAKEGTVSNWASDNKELAAFWKAVNGQNNKFQQWREMSTEDRTEFARTILGGKLHDVTRPREECQELVIHEANERFGDIENENGQRQPDPQSTQATPADNVIPLHQSPKNSDSGDSALPDKKTVRKENTIKISGQDYLKASGRVIMWKIDHPDWTLETDAIAVDPTFAVFKASIKNAEGRIVSTGHGMCTPDLAKKVSGRFVEKAETAAIARALALAGYGTDDTLDDSDYISDSPLSKTERSA